MLKIRKIIFHTLSKSHAVSKWNKWSRIVQKSLAGNKIFINIYVIVPYEPR